MTAPVCAPTLLDWAEKAGVPLLTFILGFVFSHFMLNKRDKMDLAQKNYENSVALVAQHDEAYDAYTAALKAYGDAAKATADDFFRISTTGDRYFYVLGLQSSAILSDKVDHELRDKVMLRKIREAAKRTLPLHYETLQDIAKKHQFPYTGELRRADYEAIYSVVDKFGE